MKLLALLLLSALTHAQSYKGCPLGGDGKTAAIRHLDSLKNRSLDSLVEWQDDISNMLNYKTTDPDQSSWGAYTEGYVYNVAPGGIESCNCHAKDNDDRDTHITLTPDAKHTSGKYRVIVEVTPRFRAIRKVQGIDWSTSTLRKTILHKKVRIYGWFLTDLEHANASEADRPGAKNNWRGTTLEFHPVTGIAIIKE
jgi:hypothetical protein